MTETQNALELQIINLTVVDKGKTVVTVGIMEVGVEIEEVTIIAMVVEEGTTIKEDGEGVVEGIFTKVEGALVDFSKEGEEVIIFEDAVRDMEGAEEDIECHKFIILGKAKLPFLQIARSEASVNHRIRLYSKWLLSIRYYDIMVEYLNRKSNRCLACH